MPEQRAGRKAFNEHRLGAAKRGIPFLFSFEEWWAWWQVDGRWERRGRRKDQLVMARLGDRGPYAADNVRAVTPGQNARDWRPEVRAAAIEKMRATSAKNGHPSRATQFKPGNPGRSKNAAPISKRRARRLASMAIAVLAGAPVAPELARLFGTPHALRHHGATPPGPDR